MWRLIFLFSTMMNLLSMIYPFLLKFEIKLNILRLKGTVIFTIFNKLKLCFKFRIKHGYLYIYFKGKEKKEKISRQNVNLIFMYQLINQSYFRQQLLKLNLVADFGYVLNSCATATISGGIDVVSKSVFAKIKNNKKRAHIFVKVEPKYNEDIFSIRVTDEIRMSIFDMIYSLLYALFYSWREYERGRKNKFKQN